MLAFVHMHKCAGTSVVKSARKSGLKLPARHKNGNLRTDADSNVRYAELSRSEFDGMMEELKRDGVEFLALEFDFPPLEYFRYHGIDLFTVLRHPLKRAVSNFRFAKSRGNAPPEQSFRDFMNRGSTRDGPLSRTSNYYTRKLCQLSPTDPLTADHLRQAQDTLAAFRSVVILESGELEQALIALGMNNVRTRRVSTDIKIKVVLDPEHTEVSAQDEAWFIEDNQADMTLYDEQAGSAAVDRPGRVSDGIAA